MTNRLSRLHESAKRAAKLLSKSQAKVSQWEAKTYKLNRKAEELRRFVALYEDDNLGGGPEGRHSESSGDFPSEDLTSPESETEGSYNRGGNPFGCLDDESSESSYVYDQDDSESHDGRYPEGNLSPSVSERDGSDLPDKVKKAKEQIRSAEEFLNKQTFERSFVTARAQPCSRARIELKANRRIPAKSLVPGGLAVPRSRLGLDALSALFEVMWRAQGVLGYRIRHESPLLPEEVRALRYLWQSTGWRSYWAALSADPTYVRFHRNLNYLVRRLSR